MKEKISILFLSLAIMMTTIPFSVISANATTDTEWLKIDQGSKESDLVSFDTALDNSGNGWSWDSDAKTLSLNGFNGKQIEAAGNINILLSGSNSITMPKNSMYGLHAIGDITISENSESNADENSLSINGTNIITDSNVYGIATELDKNITINGGLIDINLSRAESLSVPMYGTYSGSIYTKNSSELLIDLSNENKCVGIKGDLYSQSENPLEINFSDDVYKGTGLDGMLYSSGQGGFAVSCQENCCAINGGLSVSSTSGDINLSGCIKFKNFDIRSSFLIDTHKQITYPSDYLITYDDYEDDGILYLTDEYGSKLTYTEIGDTDGLDGHANFKVVYTELYSIGDNALSVGKEYYGREIYCMAQGGVAPYTYACNNLPDGLDIDANTGRISGTPTDAFGDGTASVCITDASGDQRTIYVPYSATVDNSSNIEVDGIEFVSSASASGSGWHYDGSGNLFLTNYNGGPIISDCNLTIRLTGNNVISITNGYYSGIDVGGNIDIVNAEDENASLAINGLDLPAYAEKYYGIKSNGDLGVSSDCTINMSRKVDSDWELNCIDSHLLFIDEAADLDINVSNSNCAIGVNAPTIMDTLGDVVVSMTPKETCQMDKAIGFNNWIDVTNVGALNISCPNYLAVHSGNFNVEDTAGNISITGTIAVCDGIILPNTKDITIPNDYLFCEDKNNTYPKLQKQDKSGTTQDAVLILKKCDNTIPQHVEIKNTEDQELTLNDSSIFDLPKLNINKSYNSGIISQFVHGGTAPYDVEITGLPSDDSISYDYDETINSIRLMVSPAGVRNSGTATMTVTDANDATKSIDINYGAITSSLPEITSIAFNKSECRLNINEEMDLTVTDSNGNIYTNVNFTSSNNEVASVSSTGKITANLPGETTITATSKIKNLSAKCIICVKFAKPYPEVVGRYITNLNPSHTYLINNKSYAADSSGNIVITPEIAGQNVSMIYCCASNPDCNSDPIVLDLNSIKDISSFKDYTTVQECTYSGQAKTPQVSIYNKGTYLSEGVDYEVNYSNNVSAGKGTVTITGLNSYIGTFTKEFVIQALDISTFDITLSNYSYKYESGRLFTPDVTIEGCKKDVDYTVDYIDNDKQGTAKVIITGINNYKGTASATFKIYKMAMQEADMALNLPENGYQYDGAAKKPDITVMDGDLILTKNIDYTLEFKNNVNPGQATVIITGIGIYGGSVEKYFDIDRCDISKFTDVWDIELFTYSGQEKKPVPASVGNLVLNKDYIITYSNNINATPNGVYAIATISGINNYKGSMSHKFVIDPQNISAVNVSLKDTSFMYDGSAKKPQIIVDKGVSYDVLYKNNINTGTGEAIVSAKGNYTGEKTLYFTINKDSISDMILSLNNNSFTFDGSEKKPTSIIPGLIFGTDYNIEYSNNVNAGRGVVTATGIGNYEGKITKYFTINTKAIDGLNVKLSNTSYIYDGNAKIPSINIEGLVLGKDYVANYINNVNVGTATVTITGIGNYSGSLNTNFKINAPVLKSTSSLSAKLYGYNDVSAAWRSVKGATGYKIMYRNVASKTYKTFKYTTSLSCKIANLTSGAKYCVKVIPYTTIKGIKYYGASKTAVVRTLKKVSTPLVGKHSKTTIRVKWTNIYGESGYQISRSTKSTSIKIISTYKTTSGSYKIFKATKNKTYYYRVRAYKTESGKVIYGPWSYAKAYKLK